MSAIRQIVLSLIVLAGALYLWIAYVPAAMPLLERAGVLDLLGIDAAEAGQAPEGQQRRGGGGPVKVIVGEVTESMRDDIVTAIGDGRAQRAVTVRSEAVGRLTEINMHSGLRVDAGDVLARLEDEAQTIALERARIMLADARADAERVQRLETTGAVTEVRRSEAELALRTAELELRDAQFELEQRRIVAPIEGWVGIIDFEVGDRIDAQAELGTITDRSQILIDFRVPERVIGDIEIGTPIEVTPLGLRNVVLTGEISAIDTTVDRASRTLRVQGRVDNEADRLRVGMAFSVTMNFPGETLLSIDPLALQWSSDGAFVWAVRDGKAAQVPVEIRQRNADQVLVEGDLEAGERIVTEGVQNLRPGADVSFDEKAAARVVTRHNRTL
jgi:RND family efflux transporter MFP subunit